MIRRQIMGFGGPVLSIGPRETEALCGFQPDSPRMGVTTHPLTSHMWQLWADKSIKMMGRFIDYLLGKC